MGTEVVPLKVEDETPIPHVWRGTLVAIVDSLIRGDTRIGQGIDNVEPLSEDDSTACRENVEAYGSVTLIPLPEGSWDTSVASWWDGNRWDCLVDLWTAEEGRSDLVLHATVFEDPEAGFRIHPGLIYVP
ncbi:hypothetical protein ACFVWG_13625 [Kribbella sp. NPDC058245]|uniref:DUF7668 domain-containing protein n=1 Tax=Kribbella sp. NPDC058245 TaxID=3346399 RepID=UPI0036E7B568